MSKEVIFTKEAPRAIGTYSQAIKIGQIVYVSGQIPLVPETMELISDDFREQTQQVFKNLAAVAKASGATLNDFVKFNVYLTDLSRFGIVNEVMSSLLKEPFPARAAIEISALPKGALVEVEGIIALP